MTATTIHRRADDLLCPFGMMDVCVLFTRTHFPVPPPWIFLPFWITEKNKLSARLKIFNIIP